MRNNCEDTETSGEGGERGASGTRAGVAHNGEAAVPLQHMEIHRNADIHLQPMEEAHWSRWMPERKVLLGRRGGGKVFLGFYFTFHCPVLILSVINSVNIPNSCLSACDDLLSDLSPSLTCEPFAMFSLPVQM